LQLSSSAIAVVHSLLLNRLETAEIIVDATTGNGGDTMFLAENSKAEAKIYAFDIQKEALKAAKVHTEKYQGKIQFILADHAAIKDHVVEKIDVAMFNLGYLPGGSHGLTTQEKSTVPAVQTVLDQLSLNGLLAIVAYPGHEEGCKEQAALENVLIKLPCSDFTVGCYKMINHKAAAPLLYLIEKVRR